MDNDLDDELVDIIFEAMQQIERAKLNEMLEDDSEDDFNLIIH
jgi:hypothetical protein